MAAGLLVLVGLGLFVAGVLTGETPFYWACVGACVVAAVLLVVARLRMSPSAGKAPASGRAASADEATTTNTTTKPATTKAPAAAAGTTATGATAAGLAAAQPAEAADAGAAAPDEAVATGSAASTAASSRADDGPAATPSADGGEPPVEEVEVTDLLLVVDLKDEVLVVDEHPRYHLSGCPHLAGQETIPIPLDEAKTDGFTPCGICRPDATIADRARARR